MENQVLLFFGSFNPIHTGHLIIAQQAYNLGIFDRVEFVISPHNPFKEKAELLNAESRKLLVDLATEDAPYLLSNSAEFHLPQPSYTIDTLKLLGKRNPHTRYSLLMGSDNLASFEFWKAYEEILDNFKLLVYPRPGHDYPKWFGHANIESLNSPLLEISASNIREMIRKGSDIKYLVDEKVRQKISTEGWYQSGKVVNKSE